MTTKTATKKKKATTMESVRDFAVDYPELLFMVANPKTDELFVSFKGKVMYGMFEGGVVARAVTEESFGSAWEQFSSQLMSTVGIDQEPGGKFVNGVLDAVQTIGEELSDNKKQHASEKSNEKGSRKKGNSKKGSAKKRSAK